MYDTHLGESGGDGGIKVIVYLPLRFVGAFPEKVKLWGDRPCT